MFGNSENERDYLQNPNMRWGYSLTGMGMGMGILNLLTNKINETEPDTKGRQGAENRERKRETEKYQDLKADRKRLTKLLNEPSLLIIVS